MNISFNNYLMSSINNNSASFQPLPFKAAMPKSLLNNKQDIVCLKNSSKESISQKIKRFFGIDLLAKNLTSKYFEKENRIYNLANKRNYYRDNIERLKTRDNGPKEVYLSNLGLANIHMIECKYEIKLLDDEIKQLYKEKHRLFKILSLLGYKITK